MIKKISKKSFNRLLKGKYSIYNNDKFMITTQYGQDNSAHLLKDIGNVLLSALTGFSYVIATPFIIIYYLLTYIPNIYIVDENIDRQKEAEELKVNKDLKKLINKVKENK